MEFFRRKLRVTISEMHNEKIKIQKFYFKHKSYDAIKEKLRISKQAKQREENLLKHHFPHYYQEFMQTNQEDNSQNFNLMFQNQFDHIYSKNFRHIVYLNQFYKHEMPEDKDDELVENLRRN